MDDIMIMESESEYNTDSPKKMKTDDKTCKTPQSKKKTFSIEDLNRSREKKIELKRKRESEKLERDKEKEEKRLHNEFLKKEKELIKDSQNKLREKERLEKEKIRKAKENERVEKEKIRKAKEDERMEKEKEQQEKEMKMSKEQEKIIKQKQAFRNFFKAKNIVDSKGNKIIKDTSLRNVLFFKPFVLKKDMKLAPLKRILFTNTQENFDTKSQTSSLYLQGLKEKTITPHKCPKTLRIPNLTLRSYNVDYDINKSDEYIKAATALIQDSVDDITEIVQDRGSPSEIASIGNIGVTTATLFAPLKLSDNLYRVKYLHFHENFRPPYYGTWAALNFIKRRLKSSEENDFENLNDNHNDNNDNNNMEADGNDIFGDTKRHTIYIASPIIITEPFLFRHEPLPCNNNTNEVEPDQLPIPEENDKETLPTTEPYANNIPLIHSIEETACTYITKIKSLGKTPFKKIFEDIIDYTYDSDEDWEEEELGESLHSVDDDEDQNIDDEIKGSEYDSDEGFIVEHGYLSEEEFLDEKEEINGPTEEMENGRETHTPPDMGEEEEEDDAFGIIKAQQKLTLQAWKDNLKKNKEEGGFKKLTPIVIGPMWTNDISQFSVDGNTMHELDDSFDRLIIRPMSYPLPINVLSPPPIPIPKKLIDLYTTINNIPSPGEFMDQSDGLIPNAHDQLRRSPKVSQTPSPATKKRYVPDEALPYLAKMIHGNSQSVFKIIVEFQRYWATLKSAPTYAYYDSDCEEPNIEIHMLPKVHIENSIKMMATYCSYSKNVFRKPCWILKTDALDKYGAEILSKTIAS